MSNTGKHTPGPWNVSAIGMEDTRELARLQGRKLEPHEGYSRDNDGAWRVTDADESSIASVSFKGKAKRGQAYCTPDPEGQANASLIASAPALLAALKGLLDYASTDRNKTNPRIMAACEAIAQAENGGK